MLDQTQPYGDQTIGPLDSTSVCTSNFKKFKNILTLLCFKCFLFQVVLIDSFFLRLFLLINVFLF